MERIKKEIDQKEYIRNRVKEEQNYANRTYLLHSERNAYMVGVYKVLLEMALKQMK